VDKVIAAMAGQTFKAPSGIVSKMDEKNHHLHKSVFIGEDQGRRPVQRGLEDARPGEGQAVVPFIEGNDKKPDEPVKK
jgi:urea transport system substrate-binding protein